ncbi:hypothetical protein [Hymenobacter saemangeumensis]|uniref:hypothetical protein n=1 Tax=Hymenobacter saemangeumensis TaxID=1084522 RepID=UPI0031E67743
MNLPAKTRILFLLPLALAACTYSENDVSPDAVIIGLTAAPAKVLADGSSKSLIAVELPKSTEDGKRSVMLSTDNGVFEGEKKPTVTVTAQNVFQNQENKIIAYANLISPLSSGNATITARTSNFTKPVTVTFERAHPERIRVLLNKLYYKPEPAGEVTITVQLARSTGKPSLGHSINLSVVDSVNRPRGNFRNFATQSDSNGQIVNYYSILTGFKGTLKVRASTQTASGAVIADSAIFYVKP